jgi:hypothetical protein
MQVRVGRSCRARHESHLPASVEHHTRHPDFAQPIQGRQRAKAIFRKANETFQTVAHASEPDLTALRTNAILDFKMFGLHTHADAEAVDREYAAFAD